MEGKVVVITGAGSGIGRACAQHFAMQGCQVIATDIDLSKARETLTLMQDEGLNSMAVNPAKLGRRVYIFFARTRGMMNL